MFRDPVLRSIECEMVELTILTTGKYLTSNELYKTLPRAINYASFCSIIEEFEKSGKIIIGGDKNCICRC